MEYSNLYTSGLRVMAQNDRESIRSSSSRSFRNFLSLNSDSGHDQSQATGHGRITSLPSRLFKRSTPKSVKQPGPFSVPTSRKGSLDISIWSRPSVETSTSQTLTMVDDYDQEADEESLWHAKTLLRTGYPASPPDTPLLTPKTPSSASTQSTTRRPLPPIPTTPLPTPYFNDEVSPTSPCVDLGTSFLFLSSRPSSVCSSTPTVIQPASRPRPTSTHSATLSLKASRRSSKVTREEIASVVFTEEVQDWKKFYVDLSLNSEDGH